LKPRALSFDPEQRAEFALLLEGGTAITSSATRRGTTRATSRATTRRATANTRKSVRT
jgi:hypothetical protein